MQNKTEVRQIVTVAMVLTLVALLFDGTFLFGQEPTATSQQAQAGTVFDQTTQQEISNRLKAIYQTGQYRGKEFAGTWSAEGNSFWLAGDGSEPKRQLFSATNGELLKPQPEVPAPKPKSNLVSPDGKWRLEQRGGSLQAKKIDSGKTIDLLQQKSGRAIQLSKLQWSPDGKHVLFIQSDATDVRRRTVLVPGDPSYPGTRTIPFARVGGEIPKHKVGVATLDTGNVWWLPIETPNEGFYLGQLEWAGNSNEILVEWMSRFRNRREFLLVPIEGEAKTVFSETNDAWAVSSQAKNRGLIWINDGQQCIIISEQDGWRHAYLYSRDGQQVALLTPGDYDLIDRGTVDKAGGWFYFYASPDNATQKYLFRVALDGTGKRQQITPKDQPGSHSYDFSPNAKWAFHTYSSINRPPVIELVDLPNHRTIKTLEQNEAVRTLMEGSPALPTEFVQLDIGDGISVDASVTKPKDFDETKKYPVLVYVYGEPHAQTVLDNWGAAQIDFHRVVASLGYIVVSIDNRGTPAPKGAAWRRAVFGSLGPISTDEQAQAIQKLGETYSWVDLSRVAIWGWSGGGSNTLNALFRRPDVYQVGIAVVPKPQPHLYNAWFQEIYMRTSEVNKDGYQKSAPINFAEGLQGKLLIITGSGETNTHIQIIEGLVDRLIELGKPFDYMVYPNRNHGLSEGKGTVVHVRMLIIRYLLQNLPAGPLGASVVYDAQQPPDKIASDLNAYWTEVSRSVREGDFAGYSATCDPKGILVSGAKKQSYPLAEALAKWKQGFEDTKAKRIQASVEFRFSQRIHGKKTAHETGIFRYATVTDGKETVAYINFEGLLRKSDDGWKIVMEYQKSMATEAEFNKLKPLANSNEAKAATP